MEFNDWLKAKGFDPASLTDTQRASLAAMWRAEQNPPTPPSPPPRTDPEPDPKPSADASLEEILARTRAENDRRAAIAGLVSRFLEAEPGQIADIEKVGRLAIEGKWTVQQAELHLLRVSRGAGPTINVATSPQATAEVLEAAVCRAAGMQRAAIEQAYSDRVLTAADRLFKGGCGLRRLLSICAQANGARETEFIGAGGLKTTLRYAFREFGEPVGFSGPHQSFGPSTYNLSGILSNVANKIILDAFNAVEMTWRRITATRPVSDFKEISSYALTGDLTYKKVGPGGEVKHGTLGEEAYGNKADLYAILLGIDYQHIRNDDLGAFAQLSKRIGRGGALTICDVFWAEWLAGQGTHWAAANSNYLAHADYAFTLEKLGNASAAWDLRTDPDGKPMGDQAKFLLVPTALGILARKYMRSTRVGEDGGDGEDNPLAGKWEVAESSYLQNSSFTGYSNSNYWLVGDPANTPAIETVFLDGQETPTVETAEPDLSRLGIQIRGMHAFGCRKQEPRAAHKFKQTGD